MQRNNINEQQQGGSCGYLGTNNMTNQQQH